MKKLAYIITAIGLITLFSIDTAAAVEYGGLGGRPANPRDDNVRSQSIFIHEMKEGTSVKDGVKVFNNTGSTKKIRVGAVDSVPSSDGSFACAQEAEPKGDVGSWISLESDTVTVEDKGEATVGFTISVPKDANVGEHNGCITIQDVQENPTPSSGGVVLSFRSAIRVAITIPGQIVKAIAVSNVAITPNKETSGIYSVQPSIVNTGNVSLDTEIDIHLVSVGGLSVASKKATYPVLAASTGRWTFDFDQPFWGGWYRADVTATFNSNVKESIGETSAQTRASSTKSSEWVFIPPSALGLVIELLAFGVVVAAIILLVRKLQLRKSIRKTWKPYTVKEGDSLQAIAEKRGAHWKHIAKANKLKAPYQLTTGAEILLPPARKK